jgi:hypothetical protein
VQRTVGAVGGRDPQVRGASIENDLESLAGGAHLDGAIVLCIFQRLDDDFSGSAILTVHGTENSSLLQGVFESQV